MKRMNKTCLVEDQGRRVDFKKLHRFLDFISVFLVERRINPLPDNNLKESDML